ncbi:hypothetical protein KSP40_PGU013568 [Platanthera guangdongensis]|uniref:ATP synthase CF0 subunit I n=1 Tax=Platanthera guangdongensis TaxID=2320717 RepID=A0ABR2MSE1_9ASPA
MTALLDFLKSRWRQREAELKLLEEETARRVEEAIRKKIEEALNSEVVKREVEQRIAEGRKKILEEVEAQLEKEKEAAHIEAKNRMLQSLSSSISSSRLPQYLFDLADPLPGAIAARIGAHLDRSR